MIKKIAILTSGGDAPGMNTVIKAAVNVALNENLETFVVKEGYLGLYNNKIEKVSKEDVKDIDVKSGTFIFTKRFPEFDNDKNRQQAVDNLNSRGIDALIVIGGDGSFRGANKLSQMGIKTIGIPGTIDGDIAFNDLTVGYLTALDTIVESIDKVKDTITSHGRIAVIEVMGKGCGLLALSAAIANDIDVLSIPEKKISEDEIISKVEKVLKNGQNQVTVLVTELMYDVNKLAKKIEEKTKKVTRATILGHTQRGGKPVPFERINAYKLGSFAVSELLKGKTGITVSVLNNKLISTPFEKTVNNKLKISEDLFNTYKLMKGNKN
ncbi:MAG: ATP-dependent 6-phosphofructokinase [Candidatus Hepatoplasma vulgare]|nr:MAG: ATP-dependent 6-phosphofructokinase [Candidatus Hepatoplasma sp.]